MAGEESTTTLHLASHPIHLVGRGLVEDQKHQGEDSVMGDVNDQKVYKGPLGNKQYF